MKVFISWSGARSKELAFALREWLPLVLQYVEPWVSEKDISAGDRWAQAIAGELESSSFGIICITPENITSPWILFESGALSKSMLDAKVIPLLFGLELSDLGGPLAQFQAQKADENGLMEIIKAINKASDTKAADGIITQLVPTLWPMLAQKMEAIPAKAPSEKHMRSQHEILEELVTGVRNINVRMREIEGDDAREFRRMERRVRDFHPGMIDELMHFSADSREYPGMGLLMLAGLVREQMPWIAELLTEGYRELRTASPDEMQKIAARLRRAVMTASRVPLKSGVLRSKSDHFLIMELPHFVERAIGQIAEPTPDAEDEQPKG